jgi:hypothetical protein
MILLDFFFASGGHTRSFLGEAEGGGGRKVGETGDSRGNTLNSKVLRMCC